ncbi:hypothetical protein EXIGLDRAFT_724522 [Exidia glandulosa HHB12029]|uniref:F-box domain-containing protein n=1 Tax=Exidia glandulosa HHB12029 TaxID=1314781 RepID=A0A165EDP4_EXIGL|nr:hypothetical protein EXIGLDRAFT_724522 [Exidia glandulosa HHB12029]
MLRDHTSEVPDEIFWKFFDEWSFTELQPALHVSVRWRCLLLDHPSYWRCITLDAPTPGAAALCLLRMARSNNRPFELLIDVNHMWDALRTSIFPAFLCHSEHIDSLSLKLHAFDAPDLAELLVAPFPLLRRFTFFVHMVEAIPRRTLLPTNLFGHKAHVLREVLLRDVDLPLLSISVFHRLTYLSFAYGTVRSPARPAPNVFRHSPHLRTLRLSGGIALLDPSYSSPSNWIGVTAFALNCPVPILQPLPWGGRPLTTLHRIHIGYGDSYISRALFDHLSGFLELVILDLQYDEPGTFETCIVGDGNMVRAFTEELWNWASSQTLLHSWFDAADTAGRLVSFTISNTLWSTVVRFLLLPLPCLAEVRLWLEPDRQTLPAENPIICANLRTLVLRSELATISVDSTALLDFAQVCLLERTESLHIVLEGDVIVRPAAMSAAARVTITHSVMGRWWHPTNSHRDPPISKSTSELLCCKH